MTYTENVQKYTISVTTAQYRGTGIVGGYYWWFSPCFNNTAFWATIRSGFTYSGSLNELAGYDAVTLPGSAPGDFSPYISSSSLSYTGSNEQCIDLLPQLMLCSSICNLGMVSTSRTQDDRSGLAMISIPAFGNSGIWEVSTPLYHNIAGKDLSSMHFYWRDARYGKRVNLSAGVCHEFILTFLK